jgi:O-methyltransferase
MQNFPLDARFLLGRVYFRFRGTFLAKMTFPTYSKNIERMIRWSNDPVRHATMALALERIRSESIPGAIAELGVYRGYVSRFLHEQMPERKLYLFDTFDGFRDNQDNRFRNTRVEILKKRLKNLNNVEFRIGVFPETAKDLRDEKFSFVLFDADKYDVAMASFEFFYPRLSPGGYFSFTTSRPSRMALFHREMGITAETCVLDVGGAPEIWNYLPFHPKVTIANLIEYPVGRFDFIKADVRELPIESGSFEVCFSNSMIEHLWTLEDQKRAASEMRRVAKRYFVQTPNFWFPIEPHFLAPFFHWLPLSLRERLAAITPRQLMEHSNRDDLLRAIQEVRLLTATETRMLFPEARVLRERFGGITKSLVPVH